jgi:Flp pilus assembly protein TadD
VIPLLFLLFAQPADDVAALKRLALSHIAREEYAEASEPLRKACDLSPGDPDACYYYGRNLYSLNRFEPALAAFERARKSGHKLWRTLAGQALALDALNRPAEAERAFREAVARTKGESNQENDPRIQLGAFLTRHGRASEALPPLAACLKGFPTSNSGLFEQAKALAQLDRNTEAAQSLQRLLSLDPSHQPARLLLDKVNARINAAR